jgi:gas vesicle structural protein
MTCESSPLATGDLADDQRISLCETLDRVLNTGVVLAGEVLISVADVDLIYLGLQVMLTSVETARGLGLSPSFRTVSPGVVPPLESIP